MKPFNLELAKAGHPICTRSGKNARIICFNKIDTRNPKETLVILINEEDHEEIFCYPENGKFFGPKFNAQHDLFMKDTEEDKNKDDRYDEIIKRIEALEKFKNEIEKFNLQKYNSGINGFNYQYQLSSQLAQLL